MWWFVCDCLFVMICLWWFVCMFAFVIFTRSMWLGLVLSRGIAIHLLDLSIYFYLNSTLTRKATQLKIYSNLKLAIDLFAVSSSRCICVVLRYIDYPSIIYDTNMTMNASSNKPAIVLIFSTCKLQPGLYQVKWGLNCVSN